MMQFENSADVAMLNAMLNTIVAEKLYDEQYIQTYVGFDAWKKNVEDFTPEEMAPICGIEADTLRRGRARLYPRRARHHLLGHGRVAAHSRHRQCALPDRAGADHRPGRPAQRRLHPLRGQNNVQGASDAGLIPMFFPDYKSVEDPENPWAVRGRVGRQARSQARQDRGRDHGRDPRQRDQGHVHRGREPCDVRSRSSTTPGVAARASRTSRRAGSLPY